MLWYKSWLDTRSRFLLGLVLLLVLAPAAPSSPSGPCRSLRLRCPRAPSSATYRCSKSCRNRSRPRERSGLCLVAVVRGQLPGLADALAALLGSGSPLVKSGAGALFSLGLPASREPLDRRRGRHGARRAVRDRVAAGHRDRRTRAARRPTVLVHRRARLRPLRIRRCELVLRCRHVPVDVFQRRLAAAAADVSRRDRGFRVRDGASGDRGLFSAMAGGNYYYGGSLPWPELLLSAAAAGAFVYSAAANIARRDF